MSRIIPGHGLRKGGRAWLDVPGVFDTRPRGTGEGVCACQDRSEVLDTDASRRAWHEEHKGTVRPLRRGIPGMLAIKAFGRHCPSCDVEPFAPCARRGSLQWTELGVMHNARIEGKDS